MAATVISLCREKGRYRGGFKFQLTCENFLKRLENLLTTMKFGLDTCGSFPAASLSEAQRIVTSYCNLTNKVLEVRKEDEWMRIRMAQKIASSERRLSELMKDLKRLVRTFMVSMSMNSDENLEAQSLPFALVDLFPDSDSWATLSWLPDLNYQQKQQDFRNARTPGSNQYVLDTSTFLDWLDSPETSSNCVHWCNGRSGVGKTILSSLVVDKLFSEKISNDVGIAYFYFDHSLQPSLTNVVGCMVKQLCQSSGSISRSVRDVYKGTQESKNLSLEELVTSVRSLNFREFYIVLDALDEYLGSVDDLLQIISQLSTAPRCKLFLTSRPENLFVKFFTCSKPLFQLNCKVDDPALVHFITTKIDKNLEIGFLINEDLREDLITEIKQKAEGSFLWATLAIPTIFDQITIHDIRDRLRELPRGLNDLFEFLIKKLSEQQKSHADFAEHVLLWLAFAEAPLSAQAICEGYAVRASDHYLNQRRLPQPGFFHTSLREYVNSRRESYFPEGQREIALTCLRYLLLKELNIPHVDYNGIRQLVTELSLCYYAATHWGDHVRNWEDNLDKLQLPFSTDIKDLAMTLVQNTRQLEITFLIRKYFETFDDLNEDFDMKSPENVVSGLEVAAGFVINVVVANLLEQGVNLRRMKHTDPSPLYSAAKGGYVKAVQSLLSAGAKIESLDLQSNVPAYYAAQKGHKEALVLLLNGQSEGTEYDSHFEEVAEATIETGNMEMFEYLFSVQTFSNSSLGRILHSAVSHRNIKAVTLLLQKGASIDGTALSNAALTGSGEMVKVLVEYGADLNKLDSQNSSALHIAARKGHLAIAKLLLETGAYPNIKDTSGRTPLYDAISQDEVSMTKYFLLQGADVQIEGNEGKTSLHRAVEKGHISIVKQLVNAGANPNVSDSKLRRQLNLVLQSSRGQAKGGRYNTLLLSVPRKLRSGLLRFDAEVVDQLYAAIQTPSIPEFKYQELPRSRKIIRMLRLYLGVLENPQIDCEIFEAEFDKDSQVLRLDQDHNIIMVPEDNINSDSNESRAAKPVPKTSDRDTISSGRTTKDVGRENSESVSSDNRRGRKIPVKIEYETLPWRWGDEKAGQYTVMIHEDGKLHRKRVSKTLGLALKYLRSEEERFLWIDAICINQEDDHEHSSQVAMMSLMYAAATMVCVWLGEDDEESRMAIKFVKEDINQLKSFDSLYRDMQHAPNRRALLMLMQRPCFSRRWVVQEIVMAKDALVYCGPDRIEWKELAIAIGLFVETETASHRISELLGRDDMLNVIPSWFEHISDLGASLLVNATARVYRSPDIEDIDKHGAIYGRKGASRRSMHSLEYLVTSLSIFDCGRPHDSVYALVAIARDVRPYAPSEASEKSAETLVTEMCEHFLEEKSYIVDYSSLYPDVCRDFTQFRIERRASVDKSQALDILCRPWAKDWRPGEPILGVSEKEPKSLKISQSSGPSYKSNSTQNITTDRKYNIRIKMRHLRKWPIGGNDQQKLAELLRHIKHHANAEIDMPSSIYSDVEIRDCSRESYYLYSKTSFVIRIKVKDLRKGPGVANEKQKLVELLKSIRYDNPDGDFEIPESLDDYVEVWNCGCESYFEYSKFTAPYNPMIEQWFEGNAKDAHADRLQKVSSKRTRKSKDCELVITAAFA